MSTLFEYTIEDVIQPHTFHDMSITTVIGVPAYIVLEETSYWLISTNSGFPYELVFVVNPMRIIVLDRDKVNLGPLVSVLVIIVFQW